jgi:GNAT superfamily N-acetyltransferase
MTPLIRLASTDEAAAVAAAVRALLSELDGTPPDSAAMESAARALLADPDAGTVLVADVDGQLVGVLAASWQVAIHVPGRYALIQDLWVRPDWRSRAVGAGLVDALVALADERRVVRLEVGIPRDDFPRLEATRGFYARNGFETLGTRMRRVLA